MTRKNEESVKIIKFFYEDENKIKYLEEYFKPTYGTQMEIGMPFYDIPEIVKKWNSVFDYIRQDILNFNYKNVMTILFDNHIISTDIFLDFYEKIKTDHLIINKLINNE